MYCTWCKETWGNYRADNNDITTKLSTALTFTCVLSCWLKFGPLNLCDRYSDKRRMEWCLLTRGVVAYLRGCAYLIILCLGWSLIQGGAHSKGRLINAQIMPPFPLSMDKYKYWTKVDDNQCTSWICNQGTLKSLSIEKIWYFVTNCMFFWWIVNLSGER